MTKKAMLDCFNASYEPLLQVHDELIFSVSDEREVKAITKIMEESVSLEVPNKVDAELGKNWGDSMIQ